MTSGYAPLGGVLVSPAIWQPFYVDDAAAPVFRHGATYAGHATACAVAMANLDVLENDGLLSRASDLEKLLRTQLEQLRAQRPSVTDVRVAGFLGGVTLRDDVRADVVADKLIDVGFVSRPLRGNTLQLSPPFITTDDELIQFVAAISHVLSEEEAT